eukprot:TRINITY_DN12529_c0_g5_i1.p1 TRINITY_DN12529_c0_g5~~TRINITY_DN12529_c0_g5_i1.p1  ORF type:complete len:496 (+),score=122.00 TRINITY_DN12529_c0_g5_i1:16-1503(+)
MKLAMVVLLAAAVTSLPQSSFRYEHHRQKIGDFHAKVPASLHASPIHQVQPERKRSQASNWQDHSNFRVNPINYGADPTGRQDSTEALIMSVQACVNQSELSPNGVFPGTFSFGNGESVRDMGGCFIDLEGGEYLISKTIEIPIYNANMQMGFGSIVASKTFPPAGFLIQIGVYDSCHVPQGSCNIDINFPSLFLDGSNVAAGCMQINHVMGTTIGPGSYMLNFTQYGVQINAGHEVMVDRSWLGETNFDFDYRKRGVAPNATAIEINGNDHYVLNTIVFSSKVGVAVNGAADYITGTHVWFPYNVGLFWNYTRAFAITGAGNRFNGCYIDGGRAVFSGGALQENTWVNGFECCSALPGDAGIILQGNDIGPGLHITHNEFGGGSVFLDANLSQPVTVAGVRIEDNYYSSNPSASRATKQLTQTTPSTTWEFSFCDVLVFPTIVSAEASLMAAQGFANVAVRPPQGCKVTVETDQAVAGTMTVKVDTSNVSADFV